MTDKWIEMVMNDTDKCHVVLLRYLDMCEYSNMQIATMAFQELIDSDDPENY